MKKLRVALIVVLIHYVIYGLVIYTQQDALFFPGTGVHVAAATLPAGARVVHLGDDGAIHALYLPPAEGQPVAIHFHGNYEFVREMGDELAPLGVLGAGVLAVEFPGYDDAPGAPTVEGFRQAGAAAYDWLRDHGIEASRIVAIGRSIGGGPACLLAGERPLAGLALLSTFASTDLLAHARGLPGFLVKQRMDNLACVAAFRGPLLIVHGTRDDVLDFGYGQALAAAAPAATFVTPDCDHNGCDHFRSAVGLSIRDWLARATPPRP